MQHDIETQARRHEGALYVAPEIKRELKLSRETWGERIGIAALYAIALGFVAMCALAALAALAR